MVANKLGNNPLLNREKKRDSLEEKKEQIIKQYGRLIHMQPKLLEEIDFEDVTFINRLALTSEDLELEELKESISKIGLLNIIYLQENGKGGYRLVSGLRRARAISEIYNVGGTIKGKDRVVIFDKETPYELLDSVSVDENIQRKNLSILEQSFKFNREAAKKDKKIEDILKEYHISKKTFYRIKNAITYPKEIIEIIEDLGADKAEILNKLVFILKDKMDAAEVVENYKDLNRDELRNLLKEIKKVDTSEKVSIKYSANGFNFSVKKKVPEEVKKYFEKLKEFIENDDYTFLK
jgi:ParB family chromosome partitioning protein